MGVGVGVGSGVAMPVTVTVTLGIVYGTPDWCIAQMRRQAELGVTDVLAWFDIGGLPAESVQRSMRLFATEVMPALAPAPV